VSRMEGKIYTRGLDSSGNIEGICIFPIPEVPMTQGGTSQARAPGCRLLRGGQSGSIVVKPLHHNHLITLMRCEPMMAPSVGHWSVFKQVFADHWDEFTHAHPRYQTSYSDALVAKMRACGHPEKIGSIAYRCLQCGQGKHVVSMSCTSSLCLRCAKVYVDN